MQYVVIASTRIEVKHPEEDAVGYRDTVQYINCTGLTHAAAMCEALQRAHLFANVAPAVKIWNGKAFVVVPLDAIEQVYSEMTGK